MGCVQSTPAPISKGHLSSEAVRNILNRFNPTFLHLYDGLYSLFSLDDLKKFAELDSTDQLKYKTEIFDCDDFSVVFLGKIREWYRNATANGGPCFGLITGDLRTDQAPDTPRYHAANIYIDPNKEVWIFEPQNDTLMKIHPNSIISSIIM